MEQLKLVWEWTKAHKVEVGIAVLVLVLLGVAFC